MTKMTEWCSHQNFLLKEHFFLWLPEGGGRSKIERPCAYSLLCAGESERGQGGMGSG
jgi:hypothetical protein